MKKYKPSKNRDAMFRDDVTEYGWDVAVFNQGFLKGWENGRDKGFTKACELIFGNSIKWTKAERLLANRVTRKLFGKKR